MLSVVGGFLFIFLARVTDVSMGTLRMLMVVRGKRLQAASIGFFEVMIFITALSKVMSSLDNPLYLIAYASGFATGNYVGSLVEEKLAMGYLTVQIITLKDSDDFVDLLRNKGFGVTVIEGKGREGIRYIIQVIIPRKNYSQLHQLVDDWDKDAFETIFDARGTKGGFLVRKSK